MPRHALITGGTGGLGQTVVRHFLSLGYQITLCDIRDDFEWPESGVALNYKKVDLLNASAVQQLSQEIVSLDVLVNLVGGFHMSSFTELKAQDLDLMWELNLKSCLQMSQAFISQLTRSEHGRIINIGARQALAGGPQATAYALSKAAVVNLTQSLAQEYLDSSLTVNAVLPSIIDTPANRAAMPDANAESWVTPKDLAHVIAFLASPEARAVSGAIVPVFHKA